MPKHPLSVLEKLAQRRADSAPRPPPRKFVQAARADDWANVVSGLGVLGFDKRMGGSWGYTSIDQLTCEDIWRGDDMMDRIITALPGEMVREGWEVGIEGDKEASEAADMAFRGLRHDGGGAGAEDKIYTALTWARAYGGCGVLLGADDGSGIDGLSKPLNENKILSLDWVTPFTPMELVPVQYYAAPIQSRFGEVASYRLQPKERPPGWGADLATLPVIHESRILRFDGEITSRGQMLFNIHPGWGDSVFVRLQQIVADFQAAWQGAGILLADFSVPVLKLKGLADLLASQDPNNQSLQSRAQAIEQARSIARTMILDSEEEYERKTTSITGLPELLQQLTNRLAAAARMPVSLLMGQAPAGLKATGDSDIRWFYDQVAAMQERKLRWQLERLHKLLFLAKDGPTKGVEPENWCLNFQPLWQLTELEQSTLRFNMAQTDALYVENQVVTPQEVAQSRFGGDAYSLETVIDMSLREEVMKIPDHQNATMEALPEQVIPSEMPEQAQVSTVRPGEGNAPAPSGKSKPPTAARTAATQPVSSQKPKRDPDE